VKSKADADVSSVLVPQAVGQVGTSVARMRTRLRHWIHATGGDRERGSDLRPADAILLSLKQSSHQPKARPYRLRQRRAPRRRGAPARTRAGRRLPELLSRHPRTASGRLVAAVPENRRFRRTRAFRLWAARRPRYRASPSGARHSGRRPPRRAALRARWQRGHPR
jgi:hypothetical protein